MNLQIYSVHFKNTEQYAEQFYHQFNTVTYLTRQSVFVRTNSDIQTTINCNLTRQQKKTRNIQASDKLRM